ncbi:MAG TPA: hypothetical protein VIJ25_04120, partial [Methylococcales bacterium]
MVAQFITDNSENKMHKQKRKNGSPINKIPKPETRKSKGSLVSDLTLIMSLVNCMPSAKITLPPISFVYQG